MAKKNKRMTFHEFENTCSQFFETRKWWFFMKNMRVWEELPGDETEGKTIWYCLWELSDKTTMFLFYDYDTDDAPFVVYVDWRRGRFDDVYFERGKFCIVGEYQDIDNALEAMCQEPTRYIANPDNVCNFDTVPTPGDDSEDRPCFGIGMFDNYSLLEAMEALDKYCKNPKEYDRGRTAEIVFQPTLVCRTTLYEKRVK